MATPFATMGELTARLDWDLDDKELAMAEAALEDASDLARAYGRSTWVDASTAPRLVRTTVLTACTRYMKNPGGYTQSRAGDETLGWAEVGEQAGAVYFTENEIKLLKGLSGQGTGGIVSVSTFAYGERPARKAIVWIPEQPGHSAFPFFSGDDAAMPLDEGYYSKDSTRYLDGNYP